MILINKDKPLLTIGMIVKNEIRCIERCLKALQPLRDTINCELIIADTGSDDGTREVIEKYADVVFDFPWINDFSAARNAVMDKAKGEWYLSIDADEYMQPDIDEFVGFISGNRSKEEQFGFIIIRNYQTKEMIDEPSDFPALRLVKMSTKARFSGAIHESLTVGDKKMRILSTFVFDHDGYAFENAEAKKKKKQRNLDILELELKKNPKDLRRLNQCIESSDAFPDKFKKYIEQGMDIIQNERSKPWDSFVYSICRYAIEIGLSCKYEKAVDWLDWCEKNLEPKSVFFTIDIAYCAALYLYEKSDYSKTIKWLEIYINTIDNIHKNGEVELLKQTVVSSVRKYTKAFEYNAKCMYSFCLYRLGDKDTALKTMLSFDITPKELRNCSDYINAAILFKDNVDIQKKVGSVFSQLIKDDSKENQNIKQQIFKHMKRMFENNGRKNYQLLKEVDGDIGISAKILDSDAIEAYELINKVEDWSLVSYQSIMKLIELSVPFPESFYARLPEKNRNTISSIFRKNTQKMTEYLLRWIECDDFTTSMCKFQCLFEMLIACARTADWKNPDNKNLCNDLYNKFLLVGSDYINNLYNRDLIESKSDWNALPAMHQFTLIIIYSNKKLENNDITGYISDLREALKIAPAMKNMIKFLTDNVPVIKQNDELVKLAEQVKQILNKYSPDDPAVLAIKQSDIYKKVAYLIEK